MRKALRMEDIDQAVRFNEPVGPDHEFYTDLNDIRGDFEERIVYKILNVRQRGQEFIYNPAANGTNKTLFFLGGMRGSGKTSELAKYVKNLNSPDCFFCVTCNIDMELDMNDVEYMDILIFQVEKLGARLKEEKVKIRTNALKNLQQWFAQRVEEINTNISGEMGLDVGVSASNSWLGKLLGVVGELKLGMSGSEERATSIRTALKNRFNDFATIFNDFVEEANQAIRKQGKGQEVLFVVDGLEKTMSLTTRRKIIMEESNRIRQIRVNTIFTLPIELMKERQKIGQFAHIESFPFVKIIDRQGQRVEKAVQRFREFVEKRIDLNLFEDKSIIDKAIIHGGGSPRELLRILEMTAFYADEESGKLSMDALDKALNRLSAQASQYITQAQLDKLSELRRNNELGLETPFDDTMQELLENIIVMEYNDGNFKLPNPVVRMSNLYQQRVVDAQKLEGS